MQFGLFMMPLHPPGTILVHAKVIPQPPRPVLKATVLVSKVPYVKRTAWVTLEGC